MNLNGSYLLWHNTSNGPLFCGVVILRDDLIMTCYSKRLVNYLEGAIEGTFELTEPYSFPVFGFNRIAVFVQDGPQREDEPFVFWIKPLLRYQS